MTKLIPSILLLLISATLVTGQELQYGLIMPGQVEREGICCVYSPEKGFSLYARPGGTKSGTLTRNIAENMGSESFYQVYFVDAKTGRTRQVEVDNFREVGYRIWALAYSGRTNGFVKIVLDQAVYWLSEQEIDQQGFKLTGWQDFLAENSGYLTGFYADSPGLNLREAPDTGSDVIMPLRGVFNRILPTREHSGPWTRVKVIIHKENPCRTHLPEEKNVQQQLEGWIKIVDDNGKPNVWYYAEGC